MNPTSASLLASLSPAQRRAVERQIAERGENFPAARGAKTKLARSSTRLVSESVPANTLSHLNVTVPVPPKELRPNGRARVHGHFVRVKRQYAEWCAACIHSALKGRPAPMWEKVLITVCLFRAGSRPWDQDNLIASLKTAADQLEKCGVVKNDMGVTWGMVGQLMAYNVEPQVNLHIRPAAAGEAR